MLGGIQIEVTVRVGQAATADRVQAILAGMPGATSVTPIAPRETGADVASFCVDAERDVREGVSRALGEAGAGVLEIVRSRRELESIFLRLTGAEPGRPPPLSP